MLTTKASMMLYIEQKNSEETNDSRHISFIHETVDWNEAEIVWAEKDKQISDVLTKEGTTEFFIRWNTGVL